MDFSTPKSLENVFSGIFTYLKLVLKHYNFAIYLLCKTYDESLQKQTVDMDLRHILCIVNSSYTVKTPKEEVSWTHIAIFTKYWKFGIVSLKMGEFEIKQETTSQKQESPIQNRKVGTNASGSRAKHWWGSRKLCSFSNSKYFLYFKFNHICKH